MLLSFFSPYILPFTKKYFKIKGNTIFAKPLHESVEIWLEKSLQLLKVKEYGKGNVRNYMQELTLLFKHYNELKVEELRQDHIERYCIFIKEKTTK